jgi:hypothetical protein
MMSPLILSGKISIRQPGLQRTCCSAASLVSPIYEQRNGKGKKSATIKNTSWSIHADSCAGSIGTSRDRMPLLAGRRRNPTKLRSD